jgi:hypothetical protein
MARGQNDWPGKGSPISEFQEFCSKTCFRPLLFLNTEFLVERDHGALAEGAASFHTTRWTIVMRAAQSQAQERQEINEEIHALCKALIATEGRLGL